MIAYHGSQEVKEKYVSRMKEHMRLDHLQQRVGWEADDRTARGCAVGCTFETYDHSRGPIEIGVPEVLMHLEDAIFEGLKESDAVGWPLRFLEAIQPGADLSRVHHQFFAWLLSGSGLLAITDDNREAIAAVAELHRRAAEGESVSDDEWSAAWSAAMSAARSAAKSAAWSAWSAARAATENAAWSAAESAAWSAAEYAAKSAAESARSARSAWSKMADKLESLLALAPMAEAHVLA